jgi:hypothetical protein
MRDRRDHDRAPSTRAQERGLLEPMWAMTKALHGHWRADEHPPYGERLRCPLCRENAVTIRLGDKAPVVFCGSRVDRSDYRSGCNAHGVRLLKAMTLKTGIWLTGRRRQPDESPKVTVERMRQTAAYESLWGKAKMLVDYLAAAVVDDGRENGSIGLSTEQGLRALREKSRQQFQRAIDEAKDAGLIYREPMPSRSPKGGRPSYAYGLVCLLPESTRKRAKTNSTGDAGTRYKPRSKPQNLGINSPESLEDAGVDVLHRTYGPDPSAGEADWTLDWRHDPTGTSANDDGDAALTAKACREDAELGANDPPASPRQRSHRVIR